MKKIILTVTAILALIVLVLLVIQSQSSSLPATYQGISLPTPAPVGDVQLPPIWLIIQGRAISGTLQSSHLSNGQELRSDVDALLQAGELATATFPADAQIVIVGTKSITGIQVKIVNDGPYGSDARSLKAEGKTEGNAAVFRLAQSGYTSGQFLSVSITFKEGEASGNVEYIWRLIPTDASAPLTPTLASSTGTLSCEPLSPAPTPAVSLASIPNAPLDLSLEDTVRLADLIILGAVVGPAVGHWDTPSGNREPGAYRIVTDTPVQVECSLKGAPPETMVIVRTEGGCVGEECVSVSHGAQLHVGQRAILFLTRNAPEYATVLVEGGQYEIRGGQEYYNVIGEGSLYEIAGDEAVAPWYRLPLAELIWLIQRNIR